MNSKISLFNKSVIKSDFKRFWWVSALNTLTVLVVFALPYIYDVIEYGSKTEISDNYIFSGLYGNSIPSVVFAIIYSAILGVLLFSYLNSSKACACLHGLPVRRETFFFSHLLSGIILTAAPLVINFAVFVLFRMNADVAKSFIISHLLTYSWLTLLYSLVAFSLAVVVTMITGNSVASIIFTGIFAVLPACAEAFVQFFCRQNIYGYDVSSSKISQFIYVVPSDMCAQPLNILKYMIFIVVFLAASLWLYKIRKLENNGEVVAFPKLRYVFTYGVAICAGAAGYGYLSSLFNNKNILLLIPFGIIGIIIAEMIVKKSLRITKVYKPVILFCVAVGLLKLAFAADLSGYERRIPKPGDIESVSVNLIGINDGVGYYTTGNGTRVYPDTDSGITNADTIEKALALHTDLIENRNDKWNYSSEYNELPMRFEYTLKNGKKLTRSYVANFENNGEAMKPLLVTEDMRKCFFPILNNVEKKYMQVYINDPRIIDGPVFNDQETVDKFIAALKADTVKTQYEKYVHRVDEYTKVSVIFKSSGTYQDGSEVPIDKMPEQNEDYYIRDDYTNTIELLKEIGFYDKIAKASDIDRIELTEAYKDTGYSYGDTDEYPESKVTVISDRKDIEEIYNYCIKQKVHYSDCNMNMNVYFKNSTLMNIAYDKNADGIPSAMR